MVVGAFAPTFRRFPTPAPRDQESGFDGKLMNAPDELTHQFASLSSDGFMFIWDIRKHHLKPDKLRKSKQEASRSPDNELPWIPLIKVQLSRIDGQVRRWALTWTTAPFG